MKRILLLIICNLTWLSGLISGDTLALKSDVNILWKIKNNGNKPEYGDYLKVHYKTYLNDEEIDNSYKRNAPLSFILGSRRILNYWDSALLNMSSGDEIQLSIPVKLIPSSFLYDLKIKEGDKLTYEIQLIEFVSCKYDLPYNGWRKDTLNLPSGIKIIVIEYGNNSKKPRQGDLVTVQYAGYFTNDYKFDASFGTYIPFSFVLGSGQVIAGWEEVVSMMGKGMKVKAIIPPELAYGEAGVERIIPPDATLIFDLQLLDYQ